MEKKNTGVNQVGTPPHSCILFEESVPVNEVGGAINGIDDPSGVVS